MNLDRKKKKKKKKTADGGRTLVPSCHLPLSLPPKFFKPGLQGVQGLININIQPSKLVFPLPFPLPPSYLQGTPFFQAADFSMYYYRRVRVCKLLYNMTSLRNLKVIKRQHAALRMGFDLTFCHETNLNAALKVEKLKVCSPVPFIFLSCWMSSSNNIIWIFVSFVGLIAIVSGNILKFYR